VTNFALGICVDATTKLALERAAAAEGMSVAQYIETALTVLLADGGYIENGETSRVRDFPAYDSSAIGAQC
jgi:hypothetical protein